MGIRGLKRALLSAGSALSPQELIPAQTHLHIDSSGFLFYLYNKLAASEACKELGGTYFSLDEFIRKELAELLDSGFKLTAYFDGKNRMKSHTAEKRRLEQEKRWNCLYELCNSKRGSVSADDQSNLPLPILSFQQLRYVFQSLGIEIVQCKFEADQEIAMQCYRNNTGFALGSEIHYCYGSDSDFYVFKGCPYIEFGSIDFETQPKALVWRRESIASMLEISEAQFVEWCILIGNDYTSHFPRERFLLNAQAIMELPMGYSQQDMARIRDLLVKAQHKDNISILSSSDPELQLAIEFSRDCYELRDLSKYPADVNAEVRVYSLSASEQSSCQELMLNIIASKYQQGLDINPTQLVLDIVETYRVKWFSFLSISDKDMLALKRMLDKIADCQVSGSFPSSQRSSLSSSLPFIPAWSDVMVAHRYQLICKELFYVLSQEFIDNHLSSSSLARGDGALDGHMINISTESAIYCQEAINKLRSVMRIAPWMFYDGRIFHECVVDALIATPEPVKNIIAQASASPISLITPPVLSTKNLMKKSSKGKASKPSSESPAIESSQTKPSSAADSSAKSAKVAVKDAPKPSDAVLPIDQYRDIILDKIARDRIVIIHGETGCGKSSRLPVMIYEDALAKKRPCKMMISQPRRIAATSLMKRVRQTLGTTIGLRMGHGVKDEDPHTKIFFVTTGYLVRYVAHHPEAMMAHTHLIIDEVHERSIDGDILCLLVKNLLDSCPNLRIILMSATIHTDLYQTYFAEKTNSDLMPLSVGVRRFPVTTYHLEDLMSMVSHNQSYAFAPHTYSVCKSLLSLLNNATGQLSEQINPKVMENQYEIIVSIIRSGKLPLGTGVFVFVSGIYDITELSVKLEKVPNIIVFVIHSDIPYEEQEKIFEPTPPDMLKVILTTNAAESSITVSDVDTIICCGTHKSMEYSSKLHRSQLRNTWISKASATQRAGRTGRVRPGTVYRLYPMSLYQKFVEHENSEVHRTPLQEVILDLDLMFETTPTFQGVIPILSELLEPPEMQNIMQSFQHLYELGMISTPSDFHNLTSLGRFAGGLPCDLQLGRLVALGIQLNLHREASILAAAIMQPKSLFRIATPLVHTNPGEYSEIVRKTFFGMKMFDDDVYSEPIMHIKILEAYIRVPESKRSAWLVSHGIVEVRMKQFLMTVKDMLRRVRDTISKSSAKEAVAASILKPWYELENQTPDPSNKNLDPNHLYPWDAQLIFRLRLLLCWTCNGQLLRMKSHGLPSLNDESSSHVIIESPKISTSQLIEIFGCPPDTPAHPPSVPWTLHTIGKRVYDAAFSIARLQAPLHSTLLAVSRVMMHSDAKVQVSYIWDLYNIGNPIKTKEYDVLHLIQYKKMDEVLDQIFGLRNSNWIALEGAKDCYATTISSPSKRQLKALKQYQELLSSPSCSLLIPAPAEIPATVESDAGTKGKKKKKKGAPTTADSDAQDNFPLPSEHGKFICNHFVPDQVLLEELFFFYSSSPAIADSDSNAKDRHIAEQILSTRQTLSFPSIKDLESLEGRAAGTARAAGSNEEKENSMKLFEDIPLGHQIFNTMRSGYKSRKIMISTPLNAAAATTTGQPASSALKNIPGSKSYAKQHPSADSNASVNRIEVSAKSLLASWQYINIASSHAVDRAPKSCILPRQSVHIASYPLTAAPVYACLHNLLEIISDQGRTTIVAEKITLFPVGNHFLRLALACMGWDIGAIIQSSSALPDKPVSISEMSLCAEIHYLLEDVLITIDRNVELVAAVESLYEEYCDNSSSSSSSVKATAKASASVSSPATPTLKAMTGYVTSKPVQGTPIQSSTSTSSKKNSKANAAAPTFIPSAQKRIPVEVLDDEDYEDEDDIYSDLEDEDEDEDDLDVGGVLDLEDLDLDDEEMQELLRILAMASLNSPDMMMNPNVSASSPRSSAHRAHAPARINKANKKSSSSSSKKK